MAEMNILLFDDPSIRQELLPFTFTRPIADIRVGILTIREKWEKAFNITTSSVTENYLVEKFPKKIAEHNLLINGAVLPDEHMVNAIIDLTFNQALVKDGKLLALWVPEAEIHNFSSLEINSRREIKTYSHDIFIIAHIWDIFTMNGIALEYDFKRLTSGRKSEPLNSNNQILGEGNIFIEAGATVNCAILNTATGPIYIGKNAEVMEGSIIRGPFALCDHSTTKLGAKIYGPTTIGPYCKVGGEINNSVLLGYSSKAHDGFLGNSVIGEWCNIGADSNNSNLKNNYAPVKLWNYVSQSFVNTGLQFCGLFMGDHSKCGINTMFNTGTVVGVSANIYGAEFPGKFVPSFSWGGAKEMTSFRLEKAFEVAQLAMSRRDRKFDDVEKKLLTEVFSQTEKYRT